VKNELEFFIRIKKVRFFKGRHLDYFSRKLKIFKANPVDQDRGIMKKNQLQNQEIEEN
jgi:hypothetical protein